jgi:hypothetical protein
MRSGLRPRNACDCNCVIIYVYMIWYMDVRISDVCMRVTYTQQPRSARHTPSASDKDKRPDATKASVSANKLQVCVARGCALIYEQAKRPSRVGFCVHLYVITCLCTVWICMFGTVEDS